ncbi:hypothetical protein ACVWXR_003595 [Pseudomonas lurida]
METTDVITFTVGVALAIVSIALGVFAIWYSQKLSESSNAALESVKDLARETKILVDASLSQQKDFSNKMLDSILQQNKFGSGAVDMISEVAPASVVTSEITKILEIFEKNIGSSIAKTMESVQASNPGKQEELKQALEAIQRDIGNLSQAAPVISSVVTGSDELRQSLQSFRDHPAHYVVLNGVVSGGLRDYEDKDRVADVYNFPSGWEDGIENLINKGVLEADGDEGFDIPMQYESLLKDWIARNSVRLDRLRNMYKKRKDKGPSAPTTMEVLVGSQFEH